MKKDELLTLFGIEDLYSLPTAVMSIIQGDQIKRNEIYRELIRLNNGDMSHDWFQELYESELSERKQKKQDFTPCSLGLLCAEIIETTGTRHEPTAGNGSMIISDWWYNCFKKLPWTHRPSQYQVSCWELSDRSIPILLLNLSIRGIMGYVYHGDVIEKTIKQKYILLNSRDDTLAFSEIFKANINDKIVEDDTKRSL